MTSADVGPPASPPAVVSKPPPAAVIRLLNPVMRAVVRSPLGRRVDSLGVLAFTGRRTGRRVEVPVGVHNIEGVDTVFTDAPWRLNFRGGGDLTVTRGGRTQPARGELVEDPEQVGPALAVAYERVGPRNLGMVVAKDSQPTAADFARLGRSMIRLHPA